MRRKYLFLLLVFGLQLGVKAPVWAQAKPLADSAKQQLGPFPRASEPSFTQLREVPPRLALGFSLGWGAPYGVGAELAYRLKPAIDGTAGVGLGSSGAKVGVGARVYLPARPARTHVFVGANLVYSYSDTEIELTDNGVTSRYLLRSSTLLHLRAGLHRPLRRHALQLALGYGVVLSPHSVIELLPGYGPGSLLSRRLLQLVGPGGVEVSVSYLLGLGHRKAVP
jgi:hypothetical protein